KKKGKKFSIRRVGPSFGIFGILLGVGGMMAGAQTLMPIAIQELIIQKFNSIGISTTMTSDAMLDVQLNQAVRVGDPDSNKGFENMFAFSEHQVLQFEKQGIKVVSNIGNYTQMTALLYKKNNTYIPVIGSD